MTEPEGVTPPLAIHLFGPLEVWRSGAPVPRLRSRKGLWLLALLTLRRGAAVDRAWLAGMLWPESADRHALALLRRDLTDLRRALGSEARRLTSPSPLALAFDLAGVEVDVLTFDAAIAQGDELSLSRAVALYRGPLLEGCAEEWAFQERQVREEAYLRALEELAGRALGRGEAVAAERYLRRAVVVNPLRESAQRQLMQALAASSNIAAATQVYRELCRRLRRDHQIEPDPETRALFEQLQAQAQRSSSLGAGRQELTASARRSNLPAQPTPLLGRQREVEMAKGLLREKGVRLLTLTGAGGTGKTRLALEVASELVDEFKDGAFVVLLAPLADAGLVASAIAQSLGVGNAEGRPLGERLKEYLRDKHLLLLLDNFEHVAAAATLVGELLAAAPRLKVLVTSRAALHLRGEHELVVAPLALPPMIDSRWSGTREAGGVDGPTKVGASDLSTISQYAAVELFIQRAVAVCADFAVTNENAPAVAEICYRLDGLPLAIELAAARIKLLSPEALLARLENRLSFLTGGARDLPARHQTLRDAMAWSYDLLDEGEKRLFQRLAVFAGGFTLEAAEAITSEFGFSVFDFGLGAEPETMRHSKSDLQYGDVLEAVESLLDKSLLQRRDGPLALDTSPSVPRYMMLETIREYARERLEESGEAHAFRSRHAAFFLAMAEEAEPKLTSGERPGWLDRLEQDQDNLRAALGWCLSSGAQASRCSGVLDGPSSEPDRVPAQRVEPARTPERLTLGLRMAGALGWFWFFRSYLSEGQQWFQRALNVGQDGDSQAARARLKALFASGLLSHEQNDFEAAHRSLAESVRLGRELGEKRLTAYALAWLGNVVPDVYRRAFRDEGVALFREVGDRWGLAMTLAFLWGRQDSEAAWQAMFEESMTLFRALGDPWGLALLIGIQGWRRVAEGEHAAARPYFEEALALRRMVGHRYSIAWTLADLAEVELHEGNLGRAAVLFAESLDLNRQMGSRGQTTRCLNGLGQVARHQGDDEAARIYFEECLSMHREAGHQPGMAVALVNLGELSLEQGGHEQAALLFTESLVLHRKCGHQRGVADALEGLAAVAAAGEPERAVRLFGAAAALRAAIDAPLPARNRAPHQRQLSALRELLGDANFTVEWGADQVLTEEEAAADALSVQVTLQPGRAKLPT